MADEVKEEALNPVEETNESEAPAEQTPAEQSVEEKPAEAAAEEAPAEDEPKPSRQQRRQSRLAEINKQLNERRQAPASLPELPAEQPQPKPLSELLKDKAEISPQELDQVANQWVAQNQPGPADVESLVDLKLAQREAYSNTRAEVGEVLSREEFNPDSDSYSPNLEKATLRTWEKAARVVYDNQGNVVSFDPTVSIKDIADSFTDVAKSYAQKQTAGVSAALSQQADEGAVTGGTQTAKTKTKFSDLSIEEMEKRLGYHKT